MILLLGWGFRTRTKPVILIDFYFVNFKVVSCLYKNTGGFCPAFSSLLMGWVRALSSIRLEGVGSGLPKEAAREI